MLWNNVYTDGMKGQKNDFLSTETFATSYVPAFYEQVAATNNRFSQSYFPFSGNAECRITGLYSRAELSCLSSLVVRGGVLAANDWTASKVKFGSQLSLRIDYLPAHPHVFVCAPCCSADPTNLEMTNQVSTVTSAKHSLTISI